MNKLAVLLAIAVLGLTACNLLKEAKEAHWAVLVAGSNGYWNYRHQSDTCHAYQILIKNGIPANRIITLAYDDIANDYSNPFPGQIFNKPDPTGKGFNVYKGCKLDYTGDDVSPSVFLNVLKGDAAANKGKGTGRVLQSTAQDKVFVYFTDHGATGLIAFPNEELYANDLIDTLKYMKDNSLYKRLVFYLEACESGSMFEGLLPNDWEIYATTAANAEESSWATYCSPEDKVNGKEINSCLGDEYSVNWMEDTEAAEKDKKLQKQFEDVRDKTKGSHVQQYGVLSWTDEELRNYQGDVTSFFSRVVSKVKETLNDFFNWGQSGPSASYLAKAKLSKIDSRDAKLHYLERMNRKQHTFASMEELEFEVRYRNRVEAFFDKFNVNFGISNIKITSVKNFDCLKRSVKALKTCTSLWGEYTLKFIKNLYTACEKTETENIEAYVKENC